MSELKKQLKICNRCYTFAISMARLAGPLAPFIHSDFKESFLFVKDHAECENCITEAKRFGKCHCEEPTADNSMV